MEYTISKLDVAMLALEFASRDGFANELEIPFKEYNAIRQWIYEENIVHCKTKDYQNGVYVIPFKFYGVNGGWDIYFYIVSPVGNEVGRLQFYDGDRANPDITIKIK